MTRARVGHGLLAGLGLAALLLVFAFRGRDDGFYDAAPAALAGPAGGIIRAEPLSAFDGARAWRVLYRSRGIDGKAIAVSGIVVAPAAKAPPGGFPVIAWAHPTTGIARRCAPSLDSDVLSSIPGLKAMIAHGFVVTATDYRGLGTEGPHPYLVGISAGRSVLDSVRAARALLPASPRFAVWGHSQGGHAALWTDQIAARYAPELTLVGVAAAAPASDLSTLFEDDHTQSFGRYFTAIALQSWSRVYGAPLESIVKEQARGDLRWIGRECLNSKLDGLIVGLAMRRLPADFLKADPAMTAPWKSFMAANTPNHLAPGVPVLIAQGNHDGAILPAITRAYVAEACRAGVHVRLMEMDADHLSIALQSVPRVVDWIADRFAQKPLPGDCATGS